MKKIITLLLCLITLGSFCVTACAVTETETATTVEFDLEIDVEKRYTDISDMDDYHKSLIDVEDEEEDAKESRKMIYIVILSILLVVAIVILVVSLRRVPSAEENVSADSSDGVKSVRTKEEKDTED